MFPEDRSSNRTDEAKLRGLRVLVAEDNVTNQKIISAILDQEGHQTTIAAHGGEVLSLLKKDKYDLILMDMRMPEMDGPAAAKAIRSQKEFDSIPIVALTAESSISESQCREWGITSYLQKPFDRVSIRGVIAKLF